MDDFINFLELAKVRRSIRSYSNKKVEKDKILRCIEAARLAPSACNSQPWKFIIIDDFELKNKIAQTTNNSLLPLNHFTIQAPVHIVVLREKSKVITRIGQTIKNKNYGVMDIAIATEHLCLQATNEGLGTCILGWFNEQKIRQLLKIPENKRPELIITLGYPGNGKIPEQKRKSIEEIYSFNTYK